MSYNYIFLSDSPPLSEDSDIKSDSKEEEDSDIESDFKEEDSFHLFDCVPYLECLEELNRSLSSLSFQDTFDISGICLPEALVNFDHHTHRDVILDV